VLQLVMLGVIIFNPDFVLMGLGERPVLDVEGVDLFMPAGEGWPAAEDPALPGAEGQPAEEGPGMGFFGEPPAEAPAPQR